MRSNYIEMPWVKEVRKEVQCAIEQGLAYTVTGAAGSGKTALCHHLAKHFHTGDQTTLYCQFGQEQDSLAGFRDLFLALEGEPKNSPYMIEKRIAPALRAVVDKIKERKVQLILLDRIDHLSSQGQVAMFELLDILQHEGCRVGMVMTGSCPANSWDVRFDAANQKALQLNLVRNLAWTGGKSGYVRFLRGHFHIQPLSSKEAGFLLHQWCSGTELLGEPLKKNLEEALRLAEALANATSRNFALLQQFAARTNAGWADKRLTISLIEEVKKEMLSATVFKQLVSAERAHVQTEFPFAA